MVKGIWGWEGGLGHGTGFWDGLEVKIQLWKQFVRFHGVTEMEDERE